MAYRCWGLAATLHTPFSESLLVTSSAAPMACWLCGSKVRASAVAILAAGYLTWVSPLMMGEAQFISPLVGI
jgi:hypothetical protein